MQQLKIEISPWLLVQLCAWAQGDAQANASESAELRQHVLEQSWLIVDELYARVQAIIPDDLRNNAYLADERRVMSPTQLASAILERAK